MDSVTFLSRYGRETGQKVFKLAHGGYLYSKRGERLNKKGSAVIYYRCVNRECGATLNLHGGIYSPGKANGWKNKEHRLHAPNVDKSSAAILYGQARELSDTDPLLTASEIMTRTVSEAPLTSQKFLPTENLLKRNLNRNLDKRFQFPDPTCLTELLIPDWDKKTKRGEKFLWYDSEDHKRILLFSTDQNIKVLRDSSAWITDGTFKSCPKAYRKNGQLYTIHGLLQEKDSQNRTCRQNSPLIYALLPDKLKSTYVNLFKNIREIVGQDYQPEYIILDFEIAAIVAWTDTYPNSKVSGCLFHLNQSIFRKAQNLSMQTRYQNDDRFRDEIKMFSALAFLPEKDVLPRFSQLTQMICKDLQPLAQYFERTYTGTATTEPLFKKQFWNVNQRVKANIPRTSNFIEGWHNKFLKTLKTHYPTMWKFLFCMLREQNSTENVLKKLKSGKGLNLQMKRYRRYNHRIKNLLKAYRTRAKFSVFEEWMMNVVKLVPNQK